VVKKVTTLVTAPKPEKDISHMGAVVDDEAAEEEAGPAIPAAVWVICPETAPETRSVSIAAKWGM